MQAFRGKDRCLPNEERSLFGALWIFLCAVCGFAYIVRGISQIKRYTPEDRKLWGPWIVMWCALNGLSLWMQWEHYKRCNLLMGIAKAFGISLLIGIVATIAMSVLMGLVVQDLLKD